MTYMFFGKNRVHATANMTAVLVSVEHLARKVGGR